MSRRITFLMLFVALTGVSNAANADTTDCQTIQIWKRKPGNYTDGADIPRIQEVKLSVAEIAAKATPRKLFDTQYQKAESFKVTALWDLLDRYNSNRDGFDLALLHFQNGMIIPISLEESLDLRDKIYVATAIKIEKLWTSDFPQVTRPDPLLRDPRPVKFCGNKMVVIKPLSFLLPGQTKTLTHFTPWRHADSLVGVELASQRAYYDQFDIGKSPQAKAGFQVFKNRCQFCHGVQLVGASLGWDYAGPIPAFEKRQPDSLFLHVKYEKAEQFRFGTIMPSQPDMQKSEATNLWHWLKDAAKNKTKPYKP